MTEKHKRFCEVYVNITNFNGGKAYKEVYGGKSSEVCNVCASKLLSKANIQQYVSELKAELRERTMLTGEKVVDELKKIGFWNIQDLLTEDNTVIDMSKPVHRDKLTPVVGIKTKTTNNVFGDQETTVEIKTADKVAALVHLGKHLGIFEVDNKQKVVKIVVSSKKSRT
jgi:phage terminase small subunit